MKIRVILQALVIVILFSSCAKDPFLLSAGTGGYGSISKSVKQAAIAPEKNSGEIILTATSEGNHLTTNTKASNPLGRYTSAVNNIPDYEQIALKPDNHKKAALIYLDPTHHKKSSDAPSKPTTDESDSNVFSILSFAFGLAGIFLRFSPWVIILALPAVIFGISALISNEKLQALGIAGLVMGLLGLTILLTLR